MYNVSLILQQKAPTHPGDIRFKEEFEVKEHIGSGNFGIVSLGIEKKTGKKVAVKIIDKKKVIHSPNPSRKNVVLDEFNVMKDISHPHVVKIYDGFEGERVNYIIME